ncbi:MAG: Eco57I restriction-modification methylase domain-containing protein [Verrucomicrobia bacterium]|nr:Eco57I restriction-modification methylase domain-containing protein [Verrucomicrobiota bacterium]
MISVLNSSLPSLFDPAVLMAGAVERLSLSAGSERGAVFTRPEVVEFMLDLVGYTSEKDLCGMRVLEPSFGHGDFLEGVISRLLKSWSRSGKRNTDQLENALVGIEVHRDTFHSTKQRLKKFLVEQDLEAETADRLLKAWLHQDDFLLKRIQGHFDVVVGNPPYVRQEMIPNELLFEYRQQFSTMYDRADLYVPFIEKALTLLKEAGSVAFICSDRWMKNKYGGPLREMVSRDFHLRYYVDMVGTPAFTTEVTAYPAITVITREKGVFTRVAHRPEINAEGLKLLVSKLKGTGKELNGAVKELPAVVGGSEPWVLEEDSLEGLGLVRRLEAGFPTLEEAGCKVGIGVATGADRVFIGKMDELNVEPSRKLPLVMTRDIDAGHVTWHGLGVVNPFGDDGKIVDLEKFPLLQSYFEKHSADLRKRHVAQKSGGCWYRTIDKITPSLARQPKLLIPDIKGRAHVVFEEGQLYPHHNLYFITSDEWNLKALQAVLMSGLARLFVATYSTKMRGGCFRFQAQYLRRIRIPKWSSISASMQDSLIAAAESGDETACNKIVAKMFGLSSKERELIATN